jgi:hypothetical protein
MLVATLSGPQLAASRPITHAYDDVLNRYRGAIPLAYMRALAKRESNMNPAERKDPAWGLMQVVESVRKSYNKRRGTSYTRQDLLNPDVNVKIAADLLNRIVVAFRKHPDRNMQPNWRNPEFVKLLTAGWNSGYSEAAGVGHVASWLEEQGVPVTHDNVFRYAAAAGGHWTLQRTAKQEWQRSVAALYFTELGVKDPGGPLVARSSSGRAGAVAVGLALFAGLGYFAWREGLFS